MSTTTVEHGRKRVKVTGAALGEQRQPVQPRREVNIELLHPEDQAELQALEGDLRALRVRMHGDMLAIDHQFYRTGRLLDTHQIAERVSRLNATLEQFSAQTAALEAMRRHCGISAA